MAETQQQNLDPPAKGPFSPLQTGCAFVMLTNMLIYLGVVLFTFNLLDPSKIDATYLAKRGFTARPEPKSEQDTTYQQLSQQKREEQQVQTELPTDARRELKQDSPAVKLSTIEQRKLSSSRPDEPEPPKAALTRSTFEGGTPPRPASTRLYSVSIYPQATVPSFYSPLQIAAPRMILMEKYETLPVELAPGINFPTFNLSVADPAGPYLYKPANPIPEASRGGLKLSVPPTGAESLYTNLLPKPVEPPAAKDQP